MRTMTTTKLPQLTDIDKVSGKTFLVRGALNAPLQNGVVTEDFRLQSILPTIKLLTDRGGRIILVGHLSGADTDSFRPIYEYLQDLIPHLISFVSDYADGAAQDTVSKMRDGEVVLFENLRQHSGEKANDKGFARMLADYGDVYVNEAFPAAHREHASVVGVPQFLPAYAGLQFTKEVKSLSRAFDPEHPFVFILGGAKFTTKLPLVEKFAGIADDVFVGGALANVYLSAYGYEVGNSRLPDADIDVQTRLNSNVLHLPNDVVCEDVSGKSTKKSVDEIDDDETIVDVGPETTTTMEDKINKAEMVVWNGPLGWYEKGYTEATDRLADTLAEADTQTILGGGDTAAIILDDKTPEDFSFVSTAGGAMVQFLADESLPGIEAVRAGQADL